MKILTYKKFLEEFRWEDHTFDDRVMDNKFVDKVANKLPKGSKILDIGYGDGSEAIYLSEKGFDVYGTDIRENDKSDLFKHITHNTKDPFPFEDNYFDLVYARLSLHYFSKEELSKIFKEIYRISKSYFIFTCKTDQGGYNSGKKFFTLEEWVDIVEAAGFKIYDKEKKSGQLYGKDSNWIEIYTII